MKKRAHSGSKRLPFAAVCQILLLFVRINLCQVIFILTVIVRECCIRINKAARSIHVLQRYSLSYLLSSLSNIFAVGNKLLSRRWRKRMELRIRNNLCKASNTSKGTLARL